jgi:hypothetical protein
MAHFAQAERPYLIATSTRSFHLDTDAEILDLDQEAPSLPELEDLRIVFEQHQSAISKTKDL